MNFTPLKNFHDDDLQSDYLVGLSYTVRPGNVELAKKVERWITEGKVDLGTAQVPFGTSRIKGKVKVS